nr:polysaccharide pyruvyl transferase family protein [Psychrosphaera haliotis]
MIFGWYGTETVGDKFILLGVIYSIFKSHENDFDTLNIISLDVNVTRKTLIELDDFVKTYSSNSEFKSFLSKFNVVDYESIYSLRTNTTYVLGGGPIMDDPILVDWWLLSEKVAKIESSKFYILGSGVGPLSRKICCLLSKSLIKNSNAKLIRNKSSLLDFDYKEVIDPAFLVYFIADKLHEGKFRPDGRLSINIRSIPFQYLKSSAAQDSNVVTEFGKYVRAFLVDTPCVDSISYFTTHQLDSTPDSVLCNSVIIKTLESNNSNLASVVESAQQEDTVSSVVEELLQSEYVIASRFHGVVLALICGCKVSGLDYGVKSKVCGLYESLGRNYPDSRTFEFNGYSNKDFLSLSDSDILSMVKQKTGPFLDLVNSK